MYKDFKKSESLDTGFVGGSGIVWMFSGIVLGLLVGLGMYYFSNIKNGHAGEAKLTSEQNTIKKEQFIKPQIMPQEQMKNISIADNSEKNGEQETEKRKNKFSYYAVLPRLNVPVSTKAVNTKAQVVKATPPKTPKNGSSRNTNKEKNIAAKKGKYLVRIASFKKKSLAKHALSVLKKRKINAILQKKKIKGRVWYRITAGPVDKASANRWKQKAEKLGHKPNIRLVK